jgi:hypothetical protein
MITKFAEFEMCCAMLYTTQHNTTQHNKMTITLQQHSPKKKFWHNKEFTKRRIEMECPQRVML